MESEVSSKAPAAPRKPGLSTVYVPLNHKHHEQANVLYGIVGNPRDSLPPVDSRQYLDFFHRVMKARSPHPLISPDTLCQRCVSSHGPCVRVRSLSNPNSRWLPYPVPNLPRG